MPTLSEVDLEELISTKPEEIVEEKDEKDPTKLKQRKPPSRGMCRRCGMNKPINRLMLCYECWVKSELEERYRWREGQPHPAECGCEMSDHGLKSFGN